MKGATEEGLELCSQPLVVRKISKILNIMEHQQSKRIQTSVLNSLEKKVLVWLAERLPKWVTSDMMTYTGSLGAIIIAAGYILSSKNINFLWLASAGFVINWFGDSLDGTIARVRNQQRPKYGFFLDHNIDCLNEAAMFIGAGLSPLMHLNIALLLFVTYLMLSVYVYISAHLKGEFKLTYIKMGPTEFRLIAIIVNTLFIYISALRNFAGQVMLFGRPFTFSLLDCVAIFIMAIIFGAYIISFVKDARQYAKEEPLIKK